MRNFFITLAFYISLFISVLFAHLAQATPLMQTDDAGIVASNQCQLELDQSLQKGAGSTVNLTPACNIGAGIEWGLPLSWSDGESSFALQAKKIWIEHATLPMQLASSVQWQPAQNQQPQLWQLNFPVSYQLSNQWQIDANLGWSQTQRFNHQSDNEQSDNSKKRYDSTWGVISHYMLNPTHHFSLEVFKQDSAQTQAQAIYQYHVVPDQVSWFASYGQSLSTQGSPWLGMGLSWASN